MKNGSKRPHPQPDEVPFDGFLIEIPQGSEPDALGRQMFTIYWRDPYLPPSGVRGQVYHAVPAEKTDEWDRKGVKWLTWGGQS